MLRWWQLIRLDVFVTSTTEICVCVHVCAHMCQCVSSERLCTCVHELRGGVDDLLWSSPGRHQHSIIPDLPDDTSRENTLPVSCRLVFFCCLLFIIFRAALPQGQVTICILFLQVFSKLSGVFIFIYLFIFLHFFNHFFSAALLKGICWWFLIPTWVPLQMTLLAWCQKETNREQRYALDKRWIPSEGREGIEGRGKEPIWSACLSFSKKWVLYNVYKYINATLKDIIRHFHSPCLLCAGWGGKQKGSKHICISESLVPRELLWAVSANLFSALLIAHQQQSLPPTPLMPGQIIQRAFNWCG